MDESVYQAAARALSQLEADWHPDRQSGGDIRFDVAARIAVDAALGLGASPRSAAVRTEALRSHVERLRRRVAQLEAVADAVQGAAIRDHNVYGEIPDEDWLAIDREDVARIIGAVAEVDRWRPWGTVLERRLGDV